MYSALKYSGLGQTIGSKRGGCKRRVVISVTVIIHVALPQLLAVDEVPGIGELG